MPQLTLYLDRDTQKTVKTAARASGLSVSRWVAKLIRERTASEWPRSFVKLIGAWASDPAFEERARPEPPDAPRERL